VTHREFKRTRPASAWSKPRRWVGRKWTPFLIAFGRGTVWGVTRQGFGIALIRYSLDGVLSDLIPISYYGDLSMLARRKVADAVAEGQQSAADQSWKPVSKMAHLIAHASTVVYADGSKRTPGRITIETSGALWKVQLTDPDSQAVLRVSAPTLSEALNAANLLLESPDTLWEPAPWLAPDAPKKKRK
jgi:hypothetical protein